MHSEYKLTHVQTDSPLPMTSFSLLKSWGIDSPIPPQPTREPWGREVCMSCWHNRARVRGQSLDPEQVAQQLCPGWLCQLAHPLGRAVSPRAACYNPGLGSPTGEAPPTGDRGPASGSGQVFPLGLPFPRLGKDGGGPVTRFSDFNGLWNTQPTGLLGRLIFF